MRSGADMIESSVVMQTTSASKRCTPEKHDVWSPRSITSCTRHSRCAGLSPNDGVSTTCEGIDRQSATSISLTPRGYSRATASMCSAISAVVTLTTNSPVRSMLSQVSFG